MSVYGADFFASFPFRAQGCSCNLECCTPDQPPSPLLSHSDFQGSSVEYPAYSAMLRQHVPCAVHHPNAYSRTCLIANSFLLWSPAHQAHTLGNLQPSPGMIDIPPLLLHQHQEQQHQQRQQHQEQQHQHQHQQRQQQHQHPLKPSPWNDLDPAVLRNIMRFLPSSVQARSRLIEKRITPVTRLVMRVNLTSSLDAPYLPGLPSSAFPQSTDMQLVINMYSWSSLGFPGADGARAELASAMPFLGRITELSLKGHLVSIRLALETLTAGTGSNLCALSKLELSRSGFPDEDTAGASAHMASIWHCISKLTSLLTLSVREFEGNFATVGAALVNINLISLAMEVSEWEGVLRMQRLRHLHLFFEGEEGAEMGQTRPWEACLNAESCPDLTHCTLSQMGSGTASTVNSPMLNSMVAWVVPLLPKLQSLTVNNTLSFRDLNSIAITTPTLQVLSTATSLQSLEIGTLPDPGPSSSSGGSVTLNSLTHLSCCMFDMRQLAITPNLTSLVAKRLLPQSNVTQPPPQQLPDQIVALSHSEFDTVTCPRGVPDYGIRFDHLVEMTATESSRAYRNYPASDYAVSFAGWDNLLSFTFSDKFSAINQSSHVNKFLSALQHAHNINRVNLENCEITMEGADLINLLAKVTHVSLDRCAVSVAAVHRIARPRAMTRLMLTRCIGITMEECRDVQQSHTGAVAFRLLYANVLDHSE